MSDTGDLRLQQTYDEFNVVVDPAPKKVLTHPSEEELPPAKRRRLVRRTHRGKETMTCAVVYGPTFKVLGMALFGKATPLKTIEQCNRDFGHIVKTLRNDTGTVHDITHIEQVLPEIATPSAARRHRLCGVPHDTKVL